jgi:hypothetical protein
MSLFQTITQETSEPHRDTTTHRGVRKKHPPRFVKSLHKNSTKQKTGRARPPADHAEVEVLAQPVLSIGDTSVHPYYYLDNAPKKIRKDLQMCLNYLSLYDIRSY